VLHFFIQNMPKRYVRTHHSAPRRRRHPEIEYPQVIASSRKTDLIAALRSAAKAAGVITDFEHEEFAILDFVMLDWMNADHGLPHWFPKGKHDEYSSFAALARL
jgi:hypothetical protein